MIQKNFKIDGTNEIIDLYLEEGMVSLFEVGEAWKGFCLEQWGKHEEFYVTYGTARRILFGQQHCTPKTSGVTVAGQCLFQPDIEVAVSRTIGRLHDKIEEDPVLKEYNIEVVTLDDMQDELEQVGGFTIDCLLISSSYELSPKEYVRDVMEKRLRFINQPGHRLYPIIAIRHMAELDLKIGEESDEKLRAYIRDCRPYNPDDLTPGEIILLNRGIAKVFYYCDSQKAIQLFRSFDLYGPFESLGYNFDALARKDFESGFRNVRGEKSPPYGMVEVVSEPY